ncbi:DNA polymerase III subunit gamma/tau [Daejeonella lutea]|uniref:DNA polymerase III subunit gamma/tau n=1 Tax=Daejeonella lutea TaxID=572036 RepID=A0A1T5BX50_9SPHI|nr:DNA polymerase III subunit gamma/tau [Daejeonella lutea]SKB51938.1 DNA polymerase-3 subunit gamma/tau [Daejeonella lutea]
MDNFIVSARKYRPLTFQTVVGQQHITGTLKNAIKNNQLAQAFLFCGPRGVGKTTCARILAKTINCQNLSPEAEACGICDSCVSFQNGNSFNIHELDAASNNSVDDIRSLIEQVRIPPQAGKYKIYIIDEVHMLSQAAFNAFLKTLEEPPSYAIFILATTEKHKILPTILSRCQIFDFNRIKVEDMALHLQEIAVKEGVSYDQDGLHLIAQKADGGLRDALSMFDQIVSFSNKNVNYKAVIENLNILDYDYYFKLTDSILSENVPGCLLIFDEILSHGFDGNHFITGLASHFRNLLVSKDASTLKLLEVSEGIRQKYGLQSAASTASFLISALNITNQCDLNYKTSKNQRLQVELALIKLCHLPSILNLSNAQPAPSENQEVKKKLEPLVKGPLPAADEVNSSLTSEVMTVPVEPVLKKSHVSVTPEETPLTPDPVLEKPKPVELEAEGQDKKVKINIPKPSLSGGASLIPNLNDLEASYSKKEELKPEYVSGESRNDFDSDTLLKYWNQYASRIKQDGKINIFTIMTSNPPTLLENFVIELIIENKVQEELLINEKVDLLNFLRTELKNFGIELTTRHVENNTKKRLYTSSEKYNHMVEKNPSLEEFRRRFNLDIDY